MSPQFDNKPAIALTLAIGLVLVGCGSAGTRSTTAAGTTPIVDAPAATAAAADPQAASAPAANVPSMDVEGLPPLADLGGAALAPPLEIPEDAMASYSRALEAMDRGAWAEAEVELEALLLEQPALAGPYANLAIIYRRDGRLVEAEAALARALVLAPNHPAANNELGILERERGHFGAAEAAYRRALEADPSYGLAHYNLGVLLDLYLQRPDEALEHYESYQSASVEADAEVDRWIQDLRRRLGLPQTTEQVAREAGQ